jgi:hypothetical protein
MEALPKMMMRNTQQRYSSCQNKASKPSYPIRIAQHISKREKTWEEDVFHAKYYRCERCDTPRNEANAAFFDLDPSLVTHYFRLVVETNSRHRDECEDEKRSKDNFSIHKNHPIVMGWCA